MALPTLSSVLPVAGPSSGGDLVRLVGAGFAVRLRVLFGSAPAVVTSVRDEAGQRIADVRTPAHLPGNVNVELTNLDTDGVPVPGETVVVAGAYRFARPAGAREADLTRIVRQLLRELKRQVLANVSATVSVDYDDTTIDGVNVIAMAQVPSLVLSGPTLRPNRFYSANVAHEDVVGGVSGHDDRLRVQCLIADVNWKPTKTGVSFARQGAWEYDPMSGSGRVTLSKDGRLKGSIRIKDGDSSTFVAVRATEPDEPLPPPPRYRDKWRRR